MIAVIFELQPKPNQQQNYLQLASELGEQLRCMEGFISVERFASLAHPEKLLSLSFWQNEEAVRKWHEFEPHQAAQAQGKKTILANFRLRVAQVIRDYSMDK